MRSGGLVLVVIVLLGAVTRVRTPQTQPTVTAAQASGTASLLQSSQQSGESHTSKLPGQDYPAEIRRNIRDFFDQEPTKGQSCTSEPHWCVPLEARAGIRFVIATVPDPVHSHLSLFFDRIIEAVEQGASSLDYNFDRAVMPWRYFVPLNAQQFTDHDTDRESYPGLMIFRNEDEPQQPLFVLVVGETPTAGINQEQFNHALEIIHGIRPEADVQHSEPEFGILGPTFSGSLYSLRVVLEKYQEDLSFKGRIIPVYATVMGSASIHAFQLSAPPQVRMAIFQEDSVTIQNALREFACGLGYEGGQIAVLSEDETQYGSPPASDSELTPCLAWHHANHEEKPGELLNLTFPREISQFRSAYSTEIPQSNATGSTGQPQQNNLRLDLEVTGMADDSVAPYNKGQTPLSQEAVMTAIVSELIRRESKIIMIRATDPLDELFLARYMRKMYPQGRLVAPTPDLLFASGEDGLLNGVLGLSTYPLTPAPLNPLCTQPTGGGTLLFTAPSVAAVYNATGALLLRLDQLSTSSPSQQAVQLQPTRAVSAKGQQPKVLGPRGALPDASPCALSPDLWLTIVSGSTIHPVKALQVEGSAFFPDSKSHGRDEDDQRNARVPVTWTLSYILCLLALGRHAWLSWTGGSFGQWQTGGQFNTSEKALKKPGQRKALILGLGGLVLTVIFVVLASALTSFRYERHWWLTALVWAPLLAFVIQLGWDFWAHRKEPLLAVLVPIASIGIVVAGLDYASWRAPGMVLWHQRAIDLGSGVSPTAPLLLVLAAVYLWFWYTFRAEALIDWRRPRLPKHDQLPGELIQLSDESAEGARQMIPSSFFSWVALVAVVIVACLALPSLVTDPGHVPVRSLEGRLFDETYTAFLGLGVALLVATLLRLLLLWRRLRFSLTALDRFGFRDALEHLSGFEWHTIWNPTWSVENEGFKLISHELQTITRLDASLGEKTNSETAALTQLRDDIKSISDLRTTIVGTLASSSAASRTFNLMPYFLQIQEKFAETAGHLITSYLDSSWKASAARGETGATNSQAEKSSDTRISVSTAVINVRTANVAGVPQTAGVGLSENSTQLAEEFVACVYANFLVSVLLRIRGLVFSAVGIYACIVFSTFFYPFEPAPSLSVLAGVLFVFGGVAVGYVYEEMHRDATLSRMTSSGPGKLDSAFWIKFASAGIVPLVGLLASLFPSVSYFLYSAVAPLLQALR